MLKGRPKSGQLNTELTHETSKFRAFAVSDVDQATGRRYT